MREYLGALVWPIRSANLPALIFGSVLAVLIPGVLSFYPYGFWAGWPLYLALAGYYAIFLRDIMLDTMAGKDRLPAWPSGQLHELGRELFTVLGPVIAAFAPLSLLVFLSRGLTFSFEHPVPSFGFVLGGPMTEAFLHGPRWLAVLATALWVAGWTALPLLLLAWPFAGPLSIFQPLRLLSSAIRAGREYVPVTLLTAALFIGAWKIVTLPVPPPFRAFESFRGYGVSFLALVAAARTIGVFYRRNRAALGWEREPSETPAPTDPEPTTLAGR